MSDIVPFPDVGRELSSREKHFLDNVRQDFAPTLKRMFPRTSDSGKTEFESVTSHFNSACEQVAKEMHGRFKDAYANADLVAMFNLRQGCVDAFFTRFKDWSKDDLLLAMTIIQSQQFLQDQLPGLPKTLNFQS